MKVNIGRTTWGNLRLISNTVTGGSGAKPHVQMCKAIERQLIGGLAAAVAATATQNRMEGGAIHPDTIIVVTVDVNIEPYALVEY